MRCPKCNQEFISVSDYGEPDKTGICGMVVHTEKEVTMLFGEKMLQPDKKCFLTRAQLNTIKAQSAQMEDWKDERSWRWHYKKNYQRP